MCVCVYQYCSRPALVRARSSLGACYARNFLTVDSRRLGTSKRTTIRRVAYAPHVMHSHHLIVRVFSTQGKEFTWRLLCEEFLNRGFSKTWERETDEYIYIYRCIYINKKISKYICISILTYTHTYISVYLSIYIHTYMYIEYRSR